MILNFNFDFLRCFLFDFNNSLFYFSIILSICLLLFAFRLPQELSLMDSTAKNNDIILKQLLKNINAPQQLNGIFVFFFFGYYRK